MHAGTDEHGCICSARDGVFVCCLRAGARDVCGDASAYGASLLCRRRMGTAAGCMRSASLSFPFSCVLVYAEPSMVGMGMMLLSCSTSSVGTGRGGVRGVRAGRECASGWNAGVCWLMRSVNLGVHGAPVYDGSAWGTPQGTGQAAGDMPMLWDRMARGMRRMPKKGNTWYRPHLACLLDQTRLLL
ncbi:hypothetical protein B0H13DRAFT_773422 [Mycena leptocephala]|nr:hypothetical protein B0H13DRAFT_773422 [Mycena leptocephala]